MTTRLEKIMGSSGGSLRQSVDRAAAAGESVENVLRIPLDQLDEDPDNCRRHFDQDELAAFAEGLKRHGQLQNAVAWKNPSTGRYQLVVGHRRFRACKLAGIPTLVVLVLPRDIAEQLKIEMQLAENTTRSDLRPTELAARWKGLMEAWGITGNELARRLGVSQATVSKKLKLLKLSESERAAVDAGTLTQAKVAQGKKATRKAGRFVEFNTPNGVGRLKRSGSLEGLIADLQQLVDQQQQRAA